MSGRLRFFVAALLLSITFIQGRAQAAGSPKLFVIWDARGKFGYMDSLGKVVIPTQFDQAYPFTEGVAAVRIGDKAGFIDPSGKPVAPFRFYTASPFSDGVAEVSVIEGGGQKRHFPCGYVDHSLQFVIEPQTKFSCEEPFHEGFAVVTTYDDGYGESVSSYINKRGEFAVAGRLAVAKSFSQGLALVNDFAKWALVNREGQTVIDLRPKNRADTFADVSEPDGSFSEGLARVGIIVDGSAGYSRFAYMNRKGQMVFKLPEQVRAKGDFHEGRASVLRNKSERVQVEVGSGERIEMGVDVSGYGYVDPRGKMVIAPKFSEAGDFSEGLAAVRTGKMQPVDRRDLAGSAAESYFDRDDGRWVCIDRKGAVAIQKCGEPLSYDEVVQRFPYFGELFGKGFVDGLFFNKTRRGRATLYGYQDKSGRYIWIQPHGKGVVRPSWWL
ncbi:MAG: WG repeat-containing protein [Acidobacteriota bacterium]